MWGVNFWFYYIGSHINANGPISLLNTIGSRHTNTKYYEWASISKCPSFMMSGSELIWLLVEEVNQLFLPTLMDRVT